VAALQSTRPESAAKIRRSRFKREAAEERSERRPQDSGSKIPTHVKSKGMDPPTRARNARIHAQTAGGAESGSDASPPPTWSRNLKGTGTDCWRLQEHPTASADPNSLRSRI